MDGGNADIAGAIYLSRISYLHARPPPLPSAYSWIYTLRHHEGHIGLPPIAISTDKPG